MPPENAAKTTNLRQPTVAGPPAQTLTLTDEPAMLAEAARSLLQHLADLQGLLRELLNVAQDKLTAMRHARAGDLRLCATREARLLEQVLRCERSRPAILARLAQGLHLPNGERPALAALTARIPEPFCSSIRARMRALREIAVELGRRNQLAAGVARELQSHIRGVFAALANADRRSVVYGPKGHEKFGGKKAWIDAVG